MTDHPNQPKDHDLLAAYVHRADPAAFAALVRRHADLVYNACLRQTRGDRHLADDATQAVFLLLAQRAHRLKPTVILAGWLYTTARHAAANALRAENRRRRHERKAASAMPTTTPPADASDASLWNDLAPLLDPAVNALPTRDRDAVLLRYFQGKNIRDVATALAISEDAAKQRCSRAVDKLRRYFTAQGVTATAAALAPLLARASANAAPPAVISAACGSALPTALTSASVTSLAKTTLFLTHLKILASTAVATAATLLIAGTTTVVLLHGTARSVRPARPAQAQPLPVAAPANPAPDQTANVTIDDIAAAVEAQRSRVDDLAVDFTYNAVRGDLDNLFYRSEMSVQLKAGKVAYRHIYSAAPSAGGRLFIRHIAFNGRQTTTRDVKTAVIDAGPTRETSLKGAGFFDLMLWNRPEVGPEGGAGDMDLVMMLRSPQASLRPGTEAVRGTPCRVVDVKWPNRDKTEVTLWLDPARGFLPIRHVWFVGPDPAKADMEFDVEEADEFPPGVWCATAGRKVLHPFGTVVKQECEWRMLLDREPNGRPKIRLNTGIDDQVFEPWRTLPSGTWLIDGRTRKAVPVGGADYDAMVKELDLSPAAADPSIAERVHGQGEKPAHPFLGSVPGRADGRSAWFWAGIVLAVVVLAGLALQVRRRRTRQA